MTSAMTNERPTHDTESVEPSRSRRPVVIVLVAIIALAVGAVGGLLLGQSSDDDPARAYATDGAELSEWQSDMVQMVDDFIVAGQTGDAQAMDDMFMEFATASLLGREFDGSDGSLGQLFEGANWTSVELVGPIVVSDNNAMFFTVDRVERPNIMEFTTSGMLQIRDWQVH